ncbi:MAG: hypothetical protein IT385_17440 [Deltaproteobacteria bacterium]|nr:hypothetical protein [Deltaproteobacteria bacterium]
MTSTEHHPLNDTAFVASRRPILWEDPLRDDAPDRTPHVRAASGIGWVGDRLAVIQDDASYLALVDPKTARARSIALPHEVDGRRRFESALGNKADKLDLEALVTWSDDAGAHVLAFGSGSTPARERWAHVVVPPSGAPTMRLVDAAPLYRDLRERSAFAGSELNVEGAVIVGDRLRMVQRGNGANLDDLVVVDATIDLDLADVRRWLAGAGPAPRPDPKTIVSYLLGELDGVRLTFTDATAIDDEVWFLACAEDSPNTYDDGRVVGSILGRLDRDGRIAERRRLVDAEGRPLEAKTEGLVGAGPGRFWVVVDMDDPERPAELWEVVVPDAGAADGRRAGGPAD